MVPIGASLQKRPQIMLKRYGIVDTRDAARMHHVLSQTFGARSFDLPHGSEGFSGKAQHAQLGSVGISYCHYGAHVEVKFPEADYSRLQIGLGGIAETGLSRSTHVISDRESCVIPPHADVMARFGKGFSQLVLRIDQPALDQKLAALLGTRPRSEITFGATIDWSNEEASRLRRLVLFVADEIARGAEVPSLILSQFEQSLIVAFLCLSRHSYRELLDRPSRAGAPWQVQRAEAYIEANWNKALTVEKLCEEVGTSARSIFATFSRARGYSPMAFLKSVRLRHARTRLNAPDADTTVTEIALVCGFQNMGHFAKDYRDEFGELPSVTLARARAKM